MTNGSRGMYTKRLRATNPLHSARGTKTDGPNQHLKQFLQLCDTFKFNEVIDDAIHLQLFFFSLIDSAFSWLDLQAPGSITSWNKLVEKFLYKFFPISKTEKVFITIGSDSSPWYKYAFTMVYLTGQDGATRGALMNQTYDDEYDLIENIMMNSC
ncbi:oligopeptide transporter 4-like [Gossypium australe]|uniref:Oligopeptide transporter 4-like n=1 Tax=Gossypium australe TaxID=47621 RepID=A0A5B6VNQ4_9ROSI|nr:oligopeptide transporter 4-like [Gossypium australe]